MAFIQNAIKDLIVRKFSVLRKVGIFVEHYTKLQMFANKTHEEAHTLMQKGDLKGSIELYTKALSEHPNDCNLISDRAVAYLHANEKENCFKDFDAALELQPNYGYRYASRAFAKNHFGDIDGAVEDYEKAVELDPDDAVAQNNLGLLLEQKGYKNAAEERFKRADKLSKEEDHLLELIDNMDENPEVKPNEKIKEIDPNDQREKNISTGQELKKVFTSKSQFKEFLNFIKNGFKIK